MLNTAERRALFRPGPRDRDELAIAFERSWNPFVIAKARASAMRGIGPWITSSPRLRRTRGAETVRERQCLVPRSRLATARERWNRAVAQPAARSCADDGRKGSLVSLGSTPRK